MTPDVRRARTAFLWVGMIVPLAMIVVSAVVVAIWLPELPEPAAVHWSGDGVDGYGPGWSFLAILCGVGGGMIIVFALLVWFAHRSPSAAHPTGSTRPEWSVTARFLGAVNLGLAGLMSVVALAAVGPQRGLTAASEAPNVGGPAAIGGFGLLIALTAVGWFLQPKIDARAADDAASAAPLSTSASERVMWIGSTTISRGGKGRAGRSRAARLRARRRGDRSRAGGLLACRDLDRDRGVHGGRIHRDPRLPRAHRPERHPGAVPGRLAHDRHSRR